MKLELEWYLKQFMRADVWMNMQLCRWILCNEVHLTILHFISYARKYFVVAMLTLASLKWNMQLKVLLKTPPFHYTVEYGVGCRLWIGIFRACHTICGLSVGKWSTSRDYSIYFSLDFHFVNLVVALVFGNCNHRRILPQISNISNVKDRLM